MIITIKNKKYDTTKIKFVTRNNPDQVPMLILGFFGSNKTEDIKMSEEECQQGHDAVLNAWKHDRENAR